MAIAVAALVLLGAFFAGVALLVVHLNRRHRAGYQEAARGVGSFGQALGGRAAPTGFEAQVASHTFTGQITHNKGTPTGLELSTPVDDATRDPGEPVGAYRDEPRSIVRGRPAIRLRRETGIDRLGKKLGINRELDTGDTAFDRAVYIESDAADGDVRRMLGDERTRRAVLDLLGLGFRPITVNAGNAPVLSATLPHPKPQEIDPSLLRAAIEHMRSIARTLPVFEGPPAPVRPWLRAWIVTALSAGLALSGLIATALCRERWPPISEDARAAGTLVGLGVWLLALPLLVALFRGRSTSFRVFIPNALILLLALPVTGAAGAIGLNGALDATAPVAHPTRVVSKHEVRGKNTVSYYLAVEDWSAERKVELEVSRNLFMAVRSGSPVVVSVNRGYFGWEWLRSVRAPDGALSQLFCPDVWDAEDLAQDAMARAFVTLGQMGEAPPNPRAWLFRE